MQTSARLVKGDKVCDATIGLSVPKNGESSTEADAVEEHSTTTVGVSATVDKMKVDGMLSDGAAPATATTNIYEERRAAEIQAKPEFQCMSDAEKAITLDFFKGKCANHNLANISPASFEDEERILRALIAADSEYQCGFDVTLAKDLCTSMGNQYDAQAESDRPAITQLLRACVFLFTPHGKNGEYYLNEADTIAQWMKEDGKDAEDYDKWYSKSAMRVGQEMYDRGLQSSPKPKLESAVG